MRIFIAKAVALLGRVEDGDAQSTIAVVKSEQWENLVTRGIDLSGGEAARSAHSH